MRTTSSESASVAPICPPRVCLICCSLTNGHHHWSRPGRGNIRTLTNRLNLASKPFSNRVLPWAVTAILVFFSLLAMALIGRSNAESNAKAAVIQKDINDLNQQLLSLVKEAEKVKNSLTLEQQLSLKSAHELVDRK